MPPYTAEKNLCRRTPWSRGLCQIRQSDNFVLNPTMDLPKCRNVPTNPTIPTFFGPTRVVLGRGEPGLGRGELGLVSQTMSELSD